MHDKSTKQLDKQYYGITKLIKFTHFNYTYTTNIYKKIVANTMLFTLIFVLIPVNAKSQSGICCLVQLCTDTISIKNKKHFC